MSLHIVDKHTCPSLDGKHHTECEQCLHMQDKCVPSLIQGLGTYTCPQYSIGPCSVDSPSRTRENSFFASKNTQKWSENLSEQLALL